MEKNTVVEKTLETLSNATKVAANLSEVSKKPAGDNKSDSKASTGNQSVQVHIGDPNKKTKEPRPIEKHVHTFPELRALTPEECELDLKKAQMEYDLVKTEQAYTQKASDREWQHKMEVEKANAKKRTVRRIIAGIVGVFGISCIGYSIWSDNRNNKNTTVNQTPVQEVNNNADNGGVK